MTTPADFKTEHLETAPPWLRDPISDVLHKAQGDAKDKIIDLVRHGVLARMPLQGPDDALGPIGAERQLPAGPGEPTATYAQRLVNAWDIWQYAGTALGVLRALAYEGFPGATITTKFNSYTLDADFNLVQTPLPSPYTFNTPNFWNTFVVTYSAPFPAAIGNPPPADGSPVSLLMKSIVQKWKAAHARFERIILIDGPVWGGAGLHWGDSGLTWGEGTVTYYVPTTP